MRPEQVIEEAERVFMAGDPAGADKVLGQLWRDTTHAPPAVLHLLGAIRSKQRDFVEAERFLRHAIRIAPSDARHHAALGELLGVAGHFGPAMDSYETALKLDPALPRLRRALAYTAMAAGRFADAEQAARAMLAQAPSVDGWDTLSCALREQGKAKEALTAADEGLKLEPFNKAAKHSRAAALLRLGRDQEALTEFDALTGQGVQAPALWLNRGQALVNLKMPGEAAMVLEDGLRRWPANLEIQKALANTRSLIS